MLATLMLVFVLNGNTQITRLLSPSMESCIQDIRVVESTLYSIGATDVHVECKQ